MILGGTLAARTADSDENQCARLSAQWGTAQIQAEPRVAALIAGRATHIPLAASAIGVAMNLEQRPKGLLWYNLYNVRFNAHYTIRNTTPADNLVVWLTLPGGAPQYSDLSFRLGGRAVDPSRALSSNGIEIPLKPGEQTTLDMAYATSGMDSWKYAFTKGVQPVNNFDLKMTTNFDAIDFPPQTLVPVDETRTSSGASLRWRYAMIVTSNDIGLSLPFPMQPGPLAQRITLWAPVALLFYFFVMLMLTSLRGVDLHPVNYFFLACAFFAFHLLFAYLVDRMPLQAAFIICSAVSMFLTVSYLRLVAGWRFAAIESGLAQLVYLVLFSWALFNEGWSGLTITIGAIATLFVSMQLTARIRWSERFA